MALQIALISRNFVVPKNLSTHAIPWSACINSALSFFLIGFLSPIRGFLFLFLVIPMTNWKDSSDGWKDSRLPRQLKAAFFSWKRLSSLSTGIQYVFQNSKLLKPVCLPQLAGKTPQSWLNKLTTTVLRRWSKCFLRINLFNLFCHTKALQNLKRTSSRFQPPISIYFLTEFLCIFWKELPWTIQLLFDTICPTNLRCFLTMCFFWQDSHHRVNFFDCTIL